MENYDLESLIILVLVLMVPALVFIIIYTAIRARRGKFRRQRITKKSSKDLQ